MLEVGDGLRSIEGAQREGHDTSFGRRIGRWGAEIARLLCLAGLLVWLAGCDNAELAPTPTLAPTAAAAVPTALVGTNSPTPEARALASTTPPAATSTPVVASATPIAPTAQPCTVPAVAGTIPLMTLPGAVRDPVALAVNQGKIYVAGRGTNNIGVVQNGGLQAILPASGVPTAIAAGDGPGELFVYYQDSQTIEHYVGERLQSTLALSPTLGAGVYLGDMLADPAGHRLFVRVNGSHASILVIDSRNFKVTASIPFTLSDSYTRMTLDSEHNHLWVAYYAPEAQTYRDALSEIDIASHAVIQTIQLPGGSNILLWDHISGHLLVEVSEASPTSVMVNNLFVYGGGRLIAQIALAGASDAALLGRRLYAANSNGTLSVIDLDRNQLVTTIATGPEPRAIVADPAAQRLYLIPTGVNGVNRLEVIDAQSNTLSGIIPLTGGADQLLADPARGRLYALLRSSEEVVVTDGGQVLARVPLERAPAQMALDDGSGRLYVTDSLARDVTIIDGTTGRLVEHHPLDTAADPPNALAVDRLHNRLLVNNRAYRLDSLAASGQFTLTGDAQTGNHSLPDFVHVNPSLPRAYAIGYNGHPGSGGTTVLYLIDSDTLTQIAVAPSRNVGAIVLDEAAQRVYAAAEPQLAVYDALNLNPIASLDSVVAVSAMTLNPATHHLFLSHVVRFSETPPPPTIEILDTRTLGQVLTMTLRSGPAALAVLGERIFVAGQDDPNILVIRDCVTAAPAARTPTPTATPYVTETPTPTTTPVGKAPTARPKTP